MVWGPNLGGGEIFRAILKGPEARPLTLTVCTGSFIGVKRKERGADHPPSSRDELRTKLELYFRLPACTLCLYWHVKRSTLPRGSAEATYTDVFYEITNRCSYMQSILFHC